MCERQMSAARRSLRRFGLSVEAVSAPPAERTASSPGISPQASSYLLEGRDESVYRPARGGHRAGATLHGGDTERPSATSGAVPVAEPTAGYHPADRRGQADGARRPVLPG